MLLSGRLWNQFWKLPHELISAVVANHIFFLLSVQVSSLILQLMEALKNECILLQWLSAIRCISCKCRVLYRLALERSVKGKVQCYLCPSNVFRTRAVPLTQLFASVCLEHDIRSHNSFVHVWSVYKCAIMNVQDNYCKNIGDICARIFTNVQ